MSGGAYNYFYRRAAGDVERVGRTLEDMAAYGGPMSSRQPSPAEAVALARVSLRFRRAAKKAHDLASELRALEEIMMAIEWWRSGDSDSSAVVDALEELEKRAG